jgi:hypothetical protein
MDCVFVRNIYTTVSFYPSKELMLEILAIYREEIEAVKSVPGILVGMVFQPLSVQSMKKMQERGGNAIGLDLDTPLTSMFLYVSFPLSSPFYFSLSLSLSFLFFNQIGFDN